MQVKEENWKDIRYRLNETICRIFCFLLKSAISTRTIFEIVNISSNLSSCHNVIRNPYFVRHTMNIVDCNGLSFRASLIDENDSRKIFRDRETCYFRGPISIGILKQLLFSVN